MTLVEMLAAITVLMMLTAILAEVFLQASKAAARASRWPRSTRWTGPSGGSW